ncbi:MAG: hypothetical protein WAT51_00225 [Holophaga sp.]
MITGHKFTTHAVLGALLVMGALACEKKLSPEALQAQESAKTADSRVAALEKELAELKTGKAQDADADHVSKGHLKSIEKQLSDAKKQAETKKKAAQELAAQPAPKEAPKVVIVEVPAGAKLEVKLAKDLSTDTVQAGDAWEGSLAESVMVDGKTVWPAGAEVRGVVSQSTPAGRLSTGNGGLGIRLTYVGKYDVESGVFLVSGTPRGERNAKYIGGAAALGALVGILTDKHNKNDHALGGAAVGAAAGTAVAAATADTVIRIPVEKPVSFTLAAPEKVTLK